MRVLEIIKLIFKIIYSCIKKVLIVSMYLAILVVVFGTYKLADKVFPELQNYEAQANKLVAESTEKTFNQVNTSYIYDKDKKLLATLKSDKDSTYLKYDDIPKDVVNAFVAVEDRTFWENEGIDPKGIVRVLYRAYVTKGSEKHGASTITQQLVKNVFLTQEVTAERKIKEIFCAYAMTRKYTKEQIMEFYVDNIYFGNNYYGIAAASSGYFNKKPKDLNLAECAFLCAIPNNPSLYNPHTKFDNVVKRQHKILKDMLSLNFITKKEYKKALKYEIKLESPPKSVFNYQVSFATDCAIKYLMKQNGFKFVYDFDTMDSYKDYQENYQDVYETTRLKLLTGGYKVYTSLDSEKQIILESAVDNTLNFTTEMDERGIFTLQGAATCIDNETGKIIAITGGRNQNNVDLSHSLNRAYQSPRQPGSTFKPVVVYTPSLERNYTPDSIVHDVWQEGYPHNSGSYAGDITLRSAVEQSKNVVAHQLFAELTPRIGLSYPKRMKFQHLVPDDNYLSSALGGLTYGTTTTEMASAYATIENKGIYRDATCIVSIKDNSNNEIYKEDESVKVYDVVAAEEMVDILKGVITNGTAHKMNWYSCSEMPAAGKTGTTNSSTDGWFCGFTPYYTIATWVGYDQPRELSGLYGGTYPASIWKYAMSQFVNGLEVKDFDKSEWENKLESDKPIEEPIDDQTNDQKSDSEVRSEILNSLNNQNNQDSSNTNQITDRGENAELSPGYTVGDYNKDNQIASEIDSIIEEMNSLDLNAAERAYDLYNLAFAKLDLIYGNTIKNSESNKLEESYNRFR
jgi:membrane peptidoglycan carboxypeptidase